MAHIFPLAGPKVRINGLFTGIWANWLNNTHLGLTIFLIFTAASLISAVPIFTRNVSAVAILNSAF
jgi:hypothetical protein